MKFLFCPCCGTSLPPLKPSLARFSCRDCLAWLKTDYRSDFLPSLRRVSNVLFLAIYVYLLYNGAWGYAIVLALGWRFLFREAVGLFFPALKVIVVSPPLIPGYRRIAAANHVSAEDLGTTIHPLGLFSGSVDNPVSARRAIPARTY